MIATVLRNAARILTFRTPGPELAAHPRPFLIFGLTCTWLAGIGRYWDNPEARWFQHAGLGSLAYVFGMAAILWCVGAPLRPLRWSYRNVLLFVALTSPPAMLYAIPVERFLSLEAAATANVWFLAVVALWRVLLLLWFLHRVCEVGAIGALSAGLLPLVAILIALSLLNLEHVVFDLMAGLSAGVRGPNDRSYAFVLELTAIALPVAPFLAAVYVFAIVVERRKRARAG